VYQTKKKPHKYLGKSLPQPTNGSSLEANPGKKKKGKIAAEAENEPQQRSMMK